MSKPNTLQHFATFEEMREHLDDEIILRVVNTYTKEKMKRKAYNKQRQEYMKLAARFVQTNADPDEIERLIELAAAQADTDEEGDPRE